MNPHCAWLDRHSHIFHDLPAGTEVLKQSGNHALVAHDSIPVIADHVAIRDGAYVVIPNPDSSTD